MKTIILECFNVPHSHDTCLLLLLSYQETSKREKSSVLETFPYGNQDKWHQSTLNHRKLPHFLFLISIFIITKCSSSQLNCGQGF